MSTSSGAQIQPGKRLQDHRTLMEKNIRKILDRESSHSSRKFVNRNRN